MSHKYQRRFKKMENNMTDDDKYTISLLNIQLQAIEIYLLSDVFFYNFAIILLQSAYNDDLESNNEIINENISLVNACCLALIASVIISNVSFIAYERVYNKKINKKIDYSINPEKGVSIASIYTILLFFINLIGAIGIYERINICEVKVSEYWIKLLNTQIYAYEIRFLADYLSLIGTMEGIELVKSKYSKEKSNVQDPDIMAVIASILYLIQRYILFYISYYVYLYSINDCVEIKDPYYFIPNLLPILGSIFGIVADIISLISFIEIYKRNVDKPVFGR